jgi:hypothetical protein
MSEAELLDRARSIVSRMREEAASVGWREPSVPPEQSWFWPVAVEMARVHLLIERGIADREAQEEVAWFEALEARDEEAHWDG